VVRFRWHADELSCSCDVCDRNRADSLRGQLVQVAREEAVPLQAGQFYEHQIVGLNVVTADGQALGQVVEVLATGANDVYVVQGRAVRYCSPPAWKWCARLTWTPAR